MKFLKSLIILSLSLLLVSCSRPTGQQASIEHRYIVALLDFSGSFQYLEASVSLLERTVDNLTPGDTLIVRAINETHLGEDLLSMTLPVKTRPIDPVNERTVRMQKVRAKQVLNALNLNQESPRTDVLGPVYAASLLFAQVSRARKQLLLFTDLEDNVRQTIPEGSLKLAGVQVAAFFIAPGSIQEDLRIREYWTNLFSKADAEIEILDVPESRGYQFVQVPH